MSDLEWPRYLFLMRHAAHHEGRLTKDGSDHVRATATRLSEWIHAEWRDEQDQNRRIRLWYTTDFTEVRETVALLRRDVIAEMQSHASEARRNPFGVPVESKRLSEPSGDDRSHTAQLLPSSATGGKDLGRVLSAYSPDTDAFDRVWQWLSSTHVGQNEARRTTSDAPLLVGNDPLIGWLAAKLLGRATPVARGELVCLVQQPPRPWLRRSTAKATGKRGGRWRLAWTISEDGDADAEAVRAKIKSKMTTAGALGTVIVGLTTFLLQNALQKEPSAWHWLAFAALGVSAALYFCALFLYDGLQMPTRFWASALSSPRSKKGRSSAWVRLRRGKSSIRRPPSSAARVLETNMVQIWHWIFTPATLLAGVGVALFAIGATNEGRDDLVNVQPWTVLVTIAGLGTFVAAWVAWHRPNLGTSD